MKKRVLSLTALLTLFVLVFSVGAFSVSETQQQPTVNSNQAKSKGLREIALEHDVEVEGISESQSEYSSFDDLAKDAVAIVYGRIIDSKSFFDESGHPIEYGEIITTEYTVDVYRVLRETKLKAPLAADKLAPASLTTPLKIARNGGVVNVNGHRAAVKVKGYECLASGKQYVFFLFWSPDYKAYVLAGGISGAVVVNEDLSLKALASSEEIQAKLRGMSLESFIARVK